MKILAVSDMVMPALYSPRVRELHGDADLVIGCGDLPYYYLEYIVTLLNVPTLYVFGNHDKRQLLSDGRVIDRPEGCISLEERTVMERGVLLAGLGGSMRYKPRAVHQYTDQEMWVRFARLVPKLLFNRVRYGRYLDIFVAHSPPFGINDGDDLPHTGFKSFLTLMRWFKPRVMLHGHKHDYRSDTEQTQVNEQTTVTNLYPVHTLE
ncbi:MAG: metallophosphoesterase, partial [Anaerolineae bacterium]